MKVPGRDGPRSQPEGFGGKEYSQTWKRALEGWPRSWGFNISFPSCLQTRKRFSGSGGKPCPPSPSPLGVALTWVEALGARLGVMEELEEEVRGYQLWEMG